MGILNQNQLREKLEAKWSEEIADRQLKIRNQHTQEELAALAKLE
ncbi:MAG: hypothetical protein ACO1OF_16340 [Adhaeribacter sp.]